MEKALSPRIDKNFFQAERAGGYIIPQLRVAKTIPGCPPSPFTPDFPFSSRSLTFSTERAPPEKYILGVCTCVYVCVCVDMTRGAMIDTGGERNRV